MTVFENKYPGFPLRELVAMVGVIDSVTVVAVPNATVEYEGVTTTLLMTYEDNDELIV